MTNMNGRSGMWGGRRALGALAMVLGLSLCLLPSVAHAAKKKSSESAEKSYPRLMVAVHGMTGHITAGEKHEELRGSVLLVDHTGRFLGVGGSAELRIRFWKFIYGNVRFGGFANVLRDSPFDAVVYPAGGIGMYSRLAFLRLEYLHMFPIGEGKYRSAGNLEVVSERWKPYAAALTGGLRLKLGNERVKGELTAGMVIGPARRFTDPLDERERALTLSFLAGLGVSFDVLK